MAGDLRAKERSIVTLTSSGGSLTNGSAGLGNATADFDARSSGNAPDDLQAQFELICQWATITSIAKDTVAADLYLIPVLDGTNVPAVDTTSGSSALPYAAFVGSFVCVKAPTANTDMRFVSPLITIAPRLYKAYILNKSGQTIAANWTLKVVSDQAQYT
jgi:hypothetical protein